MPQSLFPILLAVITATSMPPTCFSQTYSSNVEASTKISLAAFLKGFDDDLKDQFAAAVVDLNGDANLEAIIHLTSRDWCGSGGCTTLILVRDSELWRVLTQVTITKLPIRVLSRKSQGWRSIGVWVQGGGIEPGYEAELRFDGKTYPTNPSVPPARPLTGKPRGETLIAAKPAG